VRALAAIGGLAVVARLVYGTAFETYDPLWSLIWGRQLTRGELPDLDAVAVAPTSHPLANLFGAVGSLFGQGGTEFLEVLSFLSLGLLGWASYRLGRALFGAAVGVGFAFIAVTRPPIVFETLETIIDVPFLGLVMWAAALEAERPRRGWPVLALLALAGLLRPEAWLLSAAYVVYLSVGRPLREAAAWALAAASAPVVWFTFDLLSTGDPFHSLHGTQELAGVLGRPRGADTALLTLPRYLEFVMGEPLLWTGLAGVLAGLAFLYRQSLLPAGILALGLLSFLALGVAGLPLLYRYVFVPALMLCLFAAVALGGWLYLERGRTRRIWLVAAAPVAALLAFLWVPPEVDRLRDGSEQAEQIAARQGALRELLELDSVRTLLRSCLPIYVDGGLERPIVAYRLDVPPDSIRTGRVSAQAASAVFSRLHPPDAGLRRHAANGEWAVYTMDCGARSGA
jgi:hypothetical protein